MAYRPQNTLPAFELAWSMGAHGVELDVQCTRDGEVVVFHDDTLDKLTHGTGRVRDYDAAKLITLDAGAHFSVAYAGEHIPTLVQVLRGYGVKGVGDALYIVRAPNRQPSAATLALIDLLVDSIQQMAPSWRWDA